MMLKAFGRILKEHEVVGVPDVDEALARLASGEQFDIIFSDLMMPVMTGMDFYERMLTDHPDDVAKVVFVTGGAMSARTAEFLAVVPNARLLKPIMSDELRAFVDERLAATARP